MSEVADDGATGVEEISAWRGERGPGWTRDIGYALGDVLDRHRYDTRSRASKPDDPGWHPCSCGWEGYWSAFHDHVADHLRQVVLRHPQTNRIKHGPVEESSTGQAKAQRADCDDPAPQHWCSYPTGPVPVGTPFSCEVCGQHSEAVLNILKTHTLHPDVAWRVISALPDDAGQPS